MATLKGITYCPDASIAAAAAPSYSGLSEQGSPRCPATSQIGTAIAGVGAGTHPVYFQGKVYLAGPYKGAPLSLVVVTPGISGPYDLGNVVVRAAIHVDPATAQITAVADSLPPILQGIPLRYREILIELNRPDFTLNPTNCDPFSVGAQISGDQGAQATLSHHFQVANCANLPFAPKLGLKLSGGLNRRGHPAIHALFTTKPGESNTRVVAVALPPNEQLDQAHIGNVCTRVQFAANTCPASSVLGTAEASTPLLDAPLKETSICAQNPKHTLPDLVMDLRGQINIELVGTIDTTKEGALRTTFQAVPDAPVSSFVLNLAGGSKGLLVNSASLCGASRKTTVKMTGQNGLRSTQSPRLKTPCGKGAKRKRHLRRARVVG